MLTRPQPRSARAAERFGSPPPRSDAGRAGVARRDARRRAGTRSGGGPPPLPPSSSQVRKPSGGSDRRHGPARAPEGRAVPGGNEDHSGLPPPSGEKANPPTQTGPAPRGMSGGSSRYPAPCDVGAGLADVGEPGFAARDGLVGAAEPGQRELRLGVLPAEPTVRCEAGGEDRCRRVERTVTEVDRDADEPPPAVVREPLDQRREALDGSVGATTGCRGGEAIPDSLDQCIPGLAGDAPAVAWPASRPGCPPRPWRTRETRGGPNRRAGSASAIRRSGPACCRSHTGTSFPSRRR